MELSFPPAIDSTMLTTFDACPTKFLYEFVLQRAPVGRSIHLHAGGCVASAMEDIRKNFYLHQMSQDQAIEAAWPNFIRNWGMIETPEGEYKDFINCWSVIEAYFREYPLATDWFQPIIKADGSPAVEFKFGIPLEITHPVTGDPILFAGRTDMLSQPRDGYDIYVVDEKTTKTLGASWQYQWAMRGQFYGYVWAARQYGYQAVGALVRGMAIQQTQFAFQEKPLLFEEYQLNRWHLNMTRKVKNMKALFETTLEYLQRTDDYELQHQILHTIWPMSFGDACNSYGRCQYSDLCTHPSPWHLYNSYEKRIWDPISKDPTALSEDRTAGMETISMKEFLGEA